MSLQSPKANVPATSSQKNLSSRVYYGEYSLQHWIDLLLCKNIVLPEYQRSFVWNEKDVRRLIAAMRAKQFVQPVTIARYAPKNGDRKNLILDGQQRLTSILLASLSYMPNRDKILKVEMPAKEEESPEDEDSPNDETNGIGRKSINWTFNELLKFGDTVDGIRGQLAANEIYDPLEGLEIDANFFDTTFLGFSYIVPESDDETIIVQAFSQIFRNMNYFGCKLSLLESRQSLYYMVEEKRQLFEGRTADGGEIFGKLEITDDMKPCKIDFVRYLAILSQYVANGSKADKVLVGYSSYASREEFYADYVAYIQGLEQEDRLTKFDGFKFNETFANGTWQKRYKTLFESLQKLDGHLPRGKNGALESWIVADYWLFGLMYNVIFKGKVLNEDIEVLEQELASVIKAKKDDPAYAKAPNRLMNLRNRLADSIRIYESHVH